MSLFQTRYRTYYSMLCITGLWPFDDSTFAKIQRVVFVVTVLLYLSFQSMSLAVSEITLHNVLLVSTVACPMSCVLIRYVSFVINFARMKHFLKNIETDWSTLKDLVEQEIVTDSMDEARRLITMFLSVSNALLFSCGAIVASPLILDLVMPRDTPRIRTLSMVGFFVDENPYVDMISITLILTNGFGILAITCTESMVTVFAYYTSALFKIASYRIRNAVETAAKMAPVSEKGESFRTRIRRGVEMQRKAIEFIDDLTTNMAVSYLLASLMILVSIPMCQYRLFLSIADAHEVKEIILCILLLATQVIVAFLNCHSGQKIINESVDIFYQTYDSTWYCIPLSQQKLLLFIMQRSSIECTINLSSLYTAHYTGFTTMMSSSFSYFTMICSSQ